MSQSSFLDVFVRILIRFVSVDESRYRKRLTLDNFGFLYPLLDYRGMTASLSDVLSDSIARTRFELRNESEEKTQNRQNTKNRLSSRFVKRKKQAKVYGRKRKYCVSVLNKSICF